MRTHSGLHVLCGVVFRDFGALVTGGNMEPGEARMDFNLPEVPPDFKATHRGAGQRRDRRRPAVDVRVLPRDEALALPDIIRTQSNLIPPDEQEIRIVDIVGLDVQADGGTHVASTAQIGGSRWSRWRARARPTAGSGSEFSTEVVDPARGRPS